jgi:hypothetical protein
MSIGEDGSLTLDFKTKQLFIVDNDVFIEAKVTDFKAKERSGAAGLVGWM